MGKVNEQDPKERYTEIVKKRVKKRGAAVINESAIMMRVCVRIKLNLKKMGKGHTLSKIRNYMSRNMNFELTDTNQTMAIFV